MRRRRVLSIDQEESLVQLIKDMADTGESLPPLIIHGSKANILTSIPPKWAGDEDFTLPARCYALSKNKWMTTQVFEDWFESFALNTKANRPLSLILDGHILHLSMEIHRIARDENISNFKSVYFLM
uniref:DDE-1 domain-containing protein n=1 Tax=Romanomermis culicivorax TaxID=13658 RepID=A0A915HN34_ROMCU